MSDAQPVIWTEDDTEAWLSAAGNALPEDFVWPHKHPLPDGRANLQPVLPSYRLSKGYGFWLRTTPYFPGLFKEIHELLVRLDILPVNGLDLAAQLTQLHLSRGEQSNLF